MSNMEKKRKKKTHTHTPPFAASAKDDRNLTLLL